MMKHMTGMITMVMVSVILLASFAMAGYSTKYINDDFNGTSLDTTVWQTQGTIEYTVSDGCLNIPLDEANNSSGIMSKPYPVTDGNLHGNFVFSITTSSIQSNDTESFVGIGTTFQHWNGTTEDDGRTIGAMVGFVRQDENYGYVVFMVRTGTTVSQYYQSFEYKNSTNMFGETMNFHFVYDADITGVSGTAEAKLYYDGNLVSHTNGHIYNLTSEMQSGFMVNNDSDRVQGTLKIDSITVGKYTPTQENAVQIQTYTIEMSSVMLIAIVLLAISIFMYAGIRTEEKGELGMKIVKGSLVLSLLFLTYDEYVGGKTVYNIPAWVIPAIVMIVVLLFWKGYIRKKNRMF